MKRRAPAVTVTRDDRWRSWDYFGAGTREVGHVAAPTGWPLVSTLWRGDVVIEPIAESERSRPPHGMGL
jgi:hypothetical protein